MKIYTIVEEEQMRDQEVETEKSRTWPWGKGERLGGSGSRVNSVLSFVCLLVVFVSIEKSQSRICTEKKSIEGKGDKVNHWEDRGDESTASDRKER